MTLGTGAHSCSVWLQGAELGQVGTSYSKTTQLNNRKNLLSLRVGLEAVCLPGLIEQRVTDWPDY